MGGKTMDELSFLLCDVFVNPPRFVPSKTAEGLPEALRSKRRRTAGRRDPASDSRYAEKSPASFPWGRRLLRAVLPSFLSAPERCLFLPTPPFLPSFS